MKPNVTLRIAIAVFLASMGCGTTALAQTALSYFTLTPCRVVDTRGPDGVNGGPILGPATQRDFAIRGNCGVPTSAKAVTLNVAITAATTVSFLSAWPSGQARPIVATINFRSTDQALSNGATVGLSTNAQDLSVYNSDGNVHVILDVTGYYQ
jgi:serine protease